MFSSHSPADDFISKLLYVNKPWEFESVLILAHDSTLLQKNRIPWNSIKSNITFKYCIHFFGILALKTFPKILVNFPGILVLKIFLKIFIDFLGIFNLKIKTIFNNLNVVFY